jgi:hypothetical protein
LLVAAQKGYVELAGILLGGGAKLEQGKSSGWSPLCVARRRFLFLRLIISPIRRGNFALVSETKPSRIPVFRCSAPKSSGIPVSECGSSVINNQVSNWASLFLVVASAHPTGKLLVKLTRPPGPEPDDYP